MRRLLPFIAVVLLAVGAAGCGGGETVGAQPENRPSGSTQTTTTTSTSTTTSKPQGDATAGKQVFTTAGCTGCHTLSDAGSNGTVGPNLDDAKPAFDLVVDRVTNGKDGMPSFKGQLDTTQIENVAAYVSSVAGT